MKFYARLVSGSNFCGGFDVQVEKRSFGSGGRG